MEKFVSPDPMESAKSEIKALNFKQILAEAAERGSKIAIRAREVQEIVDGLKNLQQNGIANDEDLRQLAHMENWLKNNANDPLETEKQKFEEAYNGFVSVVGFNRESIKFLNLIVKDAEALVGNSDKASA